MCAFIHSRRCELNLFEQFWINGWHIWMSLWCWSCPMIQHHLLFALPNQNDSGRLLGNDHINSEAQLHCPRAGTTSSYLQALLACNASILQPPPSLELDAPSWALQEVCSNMFEYACLQPAVFLTHWVLLIWWLHVSCPLWVHDVTVGDVYSKEASGRARTLE